MIVYQSTKQGFRDDVFSNEILNGKTLFLADKAGDYQRLGLESVRLMFTTETPEECVRVLERYQGRGRYKPGDLTRGLYYRDVE